MIGVLTRTYGYLDAYLLLFCYNVLRKQQQDPESLFIGVNRDEGNNIGWAPFH